MGLLKGLLKYLLSIIFITSMFSGVMIYSFHKGIEKDFVIPELKKAFLANEQIASSFSQLHYSAKQYFSLTNATQTSIPMQNNMITITRQEANLSAEEFRNVLADKMLEGVYEKNLGNVGFNTNISVKQMDDKLLYYSKLCFILAIVSMLIMIILLSGRFVLLGVDLIFVSLLFYPIRFILDKVSGSLMQNIPGQGIDMQGFVMAVFNHAFASAKSLFFYVLIAGIVCIALGILLKFLNVGLWFQGFFEKKAKKK